MLSGCSGCKLFFFFDIPLRTPVVPQLVWFSWRGTRFLVRTQDPS